MNMPVSEKIQINGKDTLFYVAELKSEECACGRAKKPNFALCYGCYKQLPFAMQRALWQRIRAGFEAAYEDAIKWLGP